MTMSDGNDRRDAVVGIADVINLHSRVLYGIARDIARDAEAGVCDVAAALTVVERAVGELQENLDRWRRQGFITPQTEEQVARAMVQAKARRSQVARERRERRERDNPWAPFLEFEARQKAKS